MLFLFASRLSSKSIYLCLPNPCSSPAPCTLTYKGRKKIWLTHLGSSVYPLSNQAQLGGSSCITIWLRGIELRDLCFWKCNMHTNHLIILFKCKIWLNLRWSLRDYIFNKPQVNTTDTGLWITCKKVREDSLGYFPNLVRSFFFLCEISSLHLKSHLSVHNGNWSFHKENYSHYINTQPAEE